MTDDVKNSTNTSKTPTDWNSLRDIQNAEYLYANCLKYVILSTNKS